jgi:hypothetical protein
MKPVAWYDPSNGVVSTDKNSPLFTPLGQVWPLFSQRPWVGLTDEEISELIRATHNTGSFVRAIEAKLKEKNCG